MCTLSTIITFKNTQPEIMAQHTMQGRSSVYHICRSSDSHNLRCRINHSPNHHSRGRHAGRRWASKGCQHRPLLSRHELHTFGKRTVWTYSALGISSRTNLQDGASLSSLVQ